MTHRVDLFIYFDLPKVGKSIAQKQEFWNLSPEQGWKMHNWDERSLAGDQRFKLRKAPEMFLMLNSLLKEYNGNTKQFLTINSFNQQRSQNWSRISQSPRSCNTPRMVGYFL